MKTEILFDKNKHDIDKAATILRNGGLCAFPTETVYGLGANALDGNAVKNIFIAKGRPQDNPLIVHLASADDAEKYAHVNKLFHKIAQAFMPGPITVILPKRDVISDVVTCGLDSVGIRIPQYSTARELIKSAGVPIAAPSANVSGKPSPTKASHVIEDMDGKADCILCGDDCQVGVESTIVKLINDDALIICRPGGITKEMLETVCSNVSIDPAVLSKFDGKPIAPGMKYRHYAPEAPVTILVGSEEQIALFLKDKENFGLLCFDEDTILLEYENAVSLGSITDFSSQANKLFAHLRDFDKNKDLKSIYARMPEKGGVGLAVYNRLVKAAGFNIVTL